MLFQILFWIKQWARTLGKKTVPNRVNVPVHACEHYYLVTKPMEGVDSLMPVVRDYDNYIYTREWNGGILAGGFEPNPIPCFHHGVPDKFEFQLLQEDYDHFREFLEHPLRFIYLLLKAGLIFMLWLLYIWSSVLIFQLSASMERNVPSQWISKSLLCMLCLSQVLLL